MFQNTHHFQKLITSRDYLSALEADLNEAQMVRFAVAYISGAGWAQLWSHGLRDALVKPGSFGVTSMCCFTPLDRLKIDLTGELKERMKAFLNLNDNKEAEDNTALMHSKVVFILKQRESQKVGVVYIGSNNWTARGLALSSFSNSENSLRVEQELMNDLELDGVGDGLIASVNSYLLRLNGMKACLPFHEVYYPTLRSWLSKYCEGSRGNNFKRAIVLNVICSKEEYNRRIARGGLYIATRTRSEGEIFQKNMDMSVLLLVWESEDAQYNEVVPRIIRCSINTVKQPGENKTKNVAEGFINWLNGDEKATVRTKNGVSIQSWKLDQADRPRSSEGIVQLPTSYFEYQLDMLESRGKVRGEFFTSEPDLFETNFTPGTLLMHSAKGKLNSFQDQGKKVLLEDRQLVKEIEMEYRSHFGLDVQDHLTTDPRQQYLKLVKAEDPINVFLSGSARPLLENGDLLDLPEGMYSVSMPLLPEEGGEQIARTRVMRVDGAL